MTNPNPASQHCDPEIARIWSDHYMVETEWQWWADVLWAQHCLGVEAIPYSDVAATRRWLRNNRCDPWVLAEIERVERKTHHDLVARLQVFARLVGHEHHHLGMTSADVVENVTQIRVRRSLEWLGARYGLDVSHLDGYLLRGVHGPVGTDADQLDLLGSVRAVNALNGQLATAWGFPDYARCVPQVMHRSADLAVLTPLVSQVKTGPTGRSSWTAVLGGYLTMLANIAGDTWNEGDVSSSVVRRVAIPNLLMSASAALREAVDE